VHVIAEDCERHDVNCEDPRKNFESISNPVFPMREISTGIFINSAQKGASHTAIDQMKDLYFIVCKDLTPIDSWHCNSPYLQESDVGKKILHLEREREELTDTIWLATSPVQIRSLWKDFSAMLTEEPTELQKQALTYEPVDDLKSE